MEKILAFIRWVLKLNMLDKILVFVFITMITIAIVEVNRFGSDSLLNKQSNSIIDCEQRVATVAEKGVKRCDSISAEKDKLMAERERKIDAERQMYYNRKIIIETRNNKIENALK